MIYFDIINFKNSLKPNHRLLGLDIGKVRIGYALSDPQRFLATGIGTFNLKKQKMSSALIKDIIDKEQVFGIVVGYPLQMDGTEGSSCEMVNKFITKYLTSLNQPIFMQDERLSTAAVGRFFQEMELSRKQQASINDKAAASYILQGALDKLQ
jgi:putative Holliday junction resolvase